MKNTTFKLNSSPQKSKKPLIIAGLVGILLLAALIGYIVFKKDRSTLESSTTSTQKEQRSESDSADEPEPTAPVGTSATTTEEVPFAENLNVVITNASQQDSMVTATATINGANSSGTCVFLFTSPDSRPVTRQVNNVTSTCSTSVSAVEFDKVGVWNLKVTYYNNNTRAEAEKNVTVN